MAVSYLTTRPTSGPPYTTSGDAATGGFCRLIGWGSRVGSCDCLVGGNFRFFGRQILMCVLLRSVTSLSADVRLRAFRSAAISVMVVVRFLVCMSVHRCNINE
jgi:hypothetical protein